jgi:hypothetical protein
MATKKTNPTCSKAGKNLSKKGSSKSGATLGSRTCCKKKGRSTKCANKGR